MRSRRGGAAAVLLALAIALLMLLPSGAISEHLTPTRGLGLGASSTGKAPLPLFDATSAPTGATELGSLSPSSTVDFDVGLALPDQAGLGAFLTAVEDPASPSYHHFLTSTEFAQEYAPTSSEASTVKSYFVAHGAQNVVLTSDRMTLSFSLPAAQVSGTFGTSLGWFETSSGERIYAPLASPSLPSPISSLVAGVDGLTNLGNVGLQSSFQENAHFSVATGGPTDRGSPAAFDSVAPGPPYQIFWGTDYPQVYDAQSLLNAGDTGSGWAVDTILWSGYNQTNSVDLPPFDPGALNEYYQMTFPGAATLPAPAAVAVTFGGHTPPAPASTTLGDDEGAIGENSLDLEMVGSVAPSASIFCFDLSGTLLFQATTLTSLYGAFDAALSEALAYGGYPAHGLAAISNSYGLPDDNDSSWDTLEQQAAAQGVTIFASSGDAGDAPMSVTDRPQGEWPEWPSTSAYSTYGTVAVGGTTIDVTGTPYSANWDPNSGTLPPMAYDPQAITGLAAQSVWYTNLSGALGAGATAGSEGGISSVINEPLWQADSAAQSAIEYNAPKEGVHYARGVPDLSAIGDETVIFTSFVGGVIEGDLVAGTSVASPVEAGFLALIDGSDGREGYLTPALYDLGSYFLTQQPGSGIDPFHGAYGTITGGNWVFNQSGAGTGWNPMTGWGTPDILLLARDLQNPLYTSYTYNPAGVPGQAGSVSSSNNGSPSANPLLYVVLIAAVAVVVLVVVVIVVSGRRARARAGAYAPGAYGPGAYPAPSGYAPYGTPPPPTPPSYGYGPAGAPSYAPGGYPSVVYQPPYGAPPAPPPPPPPPYGAATPSYSYPAASYGQMTTCRYCGHPRPYAPHGCPTCGAPL